MIDMAKLNAVPAVPGPPVVVGTCSCGGEITKQFVKTMTYVVGGHTLSAHVFNFTCTKGGDACLQQEDIQP